jgi:asparagine synthase (glutamine-hydrolysing)
MSGIAGVIGRITETNVAEHMLATMKRRGPDAQVYIMEDDCCLMHSRGKPFDADRNEHPMCCTWAGEHYTIVCDGVLYNADEIRQELIRMGHCFESKSDTEVILHAYSQWKMDALDKFNGIFAFAIWHSKERKLFAARDRIGVKPFFYCKRNDILLFSSEIKTILAHPGISAQIDDQGVAQLLLLGPGRVPGSGVFKDVYELKPGYYGEYCRGAWKHKQYWKLEDREHTESFEETADHVHDLILDAVRLQTKGISNIGTFLSGGLDSSIISSICSDLCTNEGARLQTFSVDYENHEKYFTANKFQPESDRRYIDLMQKTLGSQHLDIILSADELIDCMDDATVARDLPGMGDVDFSLFAFSRHVRNHVSVALSGECADEIFGGYPWYRDPEIRAVDGFPWAQNTSYRAGFVRPEHIKNLDPNSFVMDHYKSTVNNCDILPGADCLERRMKELVNLNFAWFMQTLLDRNDRMTMYHNLDVRVPFCDYRIAEYLYCVPWAFKDHGNREKGLLRYAMREILPKEVLYRKKSPYPKTFDPGYSEVVSQKLRDVINDPASPVLQLVRRDSLENLLNAEFSWPWYGQLMRVPQTIAYMLQIDRWMRLYHVNFV